MPTLFRRIQRRLRPWTRPQRPEHEPVTLHRRRIYILPTRKGLLFALMLLVMLLASMNYSNSMGFALTFILAGIALTAMQQCHRNLLGVIVTSAGAEPAFAGETARFKVRLHDPGPMDRYAIKASAAGHGATANLPADRAQELTLAIPAAQRGRLALGRISIHTTFPLSLFQAWSTMTLDNAAIIYPRPTNRALAPPEAAGDDGSSGAPMLGQDDFQGLRAYRHGDSPRHIAWKAYAQAREPLVKEFTSTRTQAHWFTWESLAGIDPETRLSILCRCILHAEDAGMHYGLELPDASIRPARGEHHRRLCLEALALFNGAALAL